MITVYTYWECDGTPVEHVAVAVQRKKLIGGMFTGFTDAHGKVMFDTDPGPGQVFIGNKEAYKGEIQSTMIFYKDIVGFFGSERWTLR